MTSRIASKTILNGRVIAAVNLRLTFRALSPAKSGRGVDHINPAQSKLWPRAGILNIRDQRYWIYEQNEQEQQLTTL
jgi:hypothetical protein